MSFWCSSKGKSGYTAPQTNIESFENPDYIRNHFRSSGFKKIEIAPFSNSIEVKSIQEFLNMMIEGSAPIQLMKSKLEEPVWKEKEKIMFDHLSEQLALLPISLSSEAYITIAKKS